MPAQTIEGLYKDIKRKLEFITTISVFLAMAVYLFFKIYRPDESDIMHLYYLGVIPIYLFLYLLVHIKSVERRLKEYDSLMEFLLQLCLASIALLVITIAGLISLAPPEPKYSSIISPITIFALKVFVFFIPALFFVSACGGYELFWNTIRWINEKRK